MVVKVIPWPIEQGLSNKKPSAVSKLETFLEGYEHKDVPLSIWPPRSAPDQHDCEEMDIDEEFPYDQFTPYHISLITPDFLDDILLLSERELRAALKEHDELAEVGALQAAMRIAEERRGIKEEVAYLGRQLDQLLKRRTKTENQKSRMVSVYNVVPEGVTLIYIKMADADEIITLGDEGNKVNQLVKTSGFEEYRRRYTGVTITPQTVEGKTVKKVVGGKEHIIQTQRHPIWRTPEQGSARVYNIKSEGVTLIYGRGNGLLNVVFLDDADEKVETGVREALGYVEGSRTPSVDMHLGDFTTFRSPAYKK